jgi:hypothetical protein
MGTPLLIVLPDYGQWQCAIQFLMDRAAAVFVSKGNRQLSGVVKTKCVINFHGKILDDCDCRGWLVV